MLVKCTVVVMEWVVGLATVMSLLVWSVLCFSACHGAVDIEIILFICPHVCHTVDPREL